MSRSPHVLITGATGNLGSKLRRHLDGRYALQLIDRDSHGDQAITSADLGRWDLRWADQFNGIETVVHLAADATARQAWPPLISPNIDGALNVYHAAVRAGVKRFIYASSNHV